MNVCGNCEHFSENKSLSPFAGGWWIGDGKCSAKDTEFRFTVIGNRCDKHKVAEGFVVNE